MIQLNLLPNVKLEYIKAARTKRLVTSGSMIVVAAVLVVVGFIALTVFGLQKRHISALNKDIEKYSNELSGTEDISKILTIQNQLNRLPSLHEQKPVASRLFGYVTKLTPKDITLSDIKVNFVDNTMSIKGGSPALSHVNQFVDAIKFTNYKVEGSDAETPAFSEVVLSDFQRNDLSTGYRYEITLKFDPAIFDGKQSTTLVVPNIITSRSEQEKPTLFEKEEEVQ